MATKTTSRRGRKPRTPAEKKAFSAKMSTLAKEGYRDPAQRAAIAYSELRRGGLARLKKNSGKKKRRGRSG